MDRTWARYLGTILACGMVLAQGAAAQNAPAPVAPAPRAAGPRFPPPLGNGPWDFQTGGARLHVEVVTKGLERPWALALLPDGGMLVTERPGRLRIIRGGVLDPRPIEGVPAVYHVGIAGLMDVVLHPDFAHNHLIYLSYSKPDPAVAKPDAQTNATLAVMRARWDGGYRLTDVKDIFVADSWYGKPPLKAKCCGQGPAFGSFGGRLAFDKTGHLLVTSGDRNWGERAQDPANDFGKILRLNDDGSIPRDNPFVGRAGFKPEIWTIGHRNPTGLRFDSRGRLWDIEHGPKGGDELNHVERGRNYGWMVVSEGDGYDGVPYPRHSTDPGFVAPAIAWTPDIGPGDLAFYSGKLWPQWRGQALVAALTVPSLIRLSFAGDKATEVARLAFPARLREVVEAPDGSLYLLTDDNAGALLRGTPGR